MQSSHYKYRTSQTVSAIKCYHLYGREDDLRRPRPLPEQLSIIDYSNVGDRITGECSRTSANGTVIGEDLNVRVDGLRQWSYELASRKL